MSKRDKMGNFVTNPNSNMALVLKCLGDGMHDRQGIADYLGLTYNQVAYAIRNLWAKGKIDKSENQIGLGRGRGQTFAKYTPKAEKPFTGVSFIFGKL
jgi:predicted ArsR family transcriptional regulator